MTLFGKMVPVRELAVGLAPEVKAFLKGVIRDAGRSVRDKSVFEEMLSDAYEWLEMYCTKVVRQAAA